MEPCSRRARSERSDSGGGRRPLVEPPAPHAANADRHEQLRYHSRSPRGHAGDGSSAPQEPNRVHRGGAVRGCPVSKVALGPEPQHSTPPPVVTTQLFPCRTETAAAVAGCVADARNVRSAIGTTSARLSRSASAYRPSMSAFYREHTSHATVMARATCPSKTDPGAMLGLDRKGAMHGDATARDGGDHHEATGGGCGPGPGVRPSDRSVGRGQCAPRRAEQ